MPHYVQANIIKPHSKPLTLVFLKYLRQELSQLCIPHLHTMQGYPKIKIEHSNVTEESVHAQVSVTYSKIRPSPPTPKSQSRTVTPLHLVVLSL